MTSFLPGDEFGIISRESTTARDESTTNAQAKQGSTGFPPPFHTSLKNKLSNRIFGQESNLFGIYRPVYTALEHQLHPERVFAESAGIEPAKDGFTRPSLILKTS